jgi:hypothetical protein
MKQKIEILSSQSDSGVTCPVFIIQKNTLLQVKWSILEEGTIALLRPIALVSPCQGNEYNNRAVFKG